MPPLWQILLMTTITILLINTTIRSWRKLAYRSKQKQKQVESEQEFLSWRLVVETNNMVPWLKNPTWCIPHLEKYYVYGGQYQRDMTMATNQISSYVNTIHPHQDGKDVWIFDVDDTCLSNIPYVQQIKFGVLPYDAKEFEDWVNKGDCPAIVDVLRVYKKLIAIGFKVVIITSRNEEHGVSTAKNLDKQGFKEHQRLIMRTPEYKGKSSMAYKSAIRKKLVAEGFRIRGNVGDQWSDLSGDCAGERVFKLPNPIYIIL